MAIAPLHTLPIRCHKACTTRVRAFRTLLLAALVVGVSSAHGQGFPTGPRGLSGGGSGGGPGQGGPIKLERIKEDTTPVYFFFADAPGQKTLFSDTLPDALFHQYDPTRRRDFDYKNLGIPGSAHQALVYAPRLRRGFDPGFHQYDLYLLEARSLPFYQLDKPFTNLAFSRGSDQSNSSFNAQFSRNFANGLNFSLDYRRLAEVGTAAQFPNQKGRNTALAAGFWIKDKAGRYEAFAVFADNKLEHEDNGGIVEEPAREGAFFSPASTNVYLDGAGTRHRHQELLYTHYYRLSKPDSNQTAVPSGPGFLLGHQTMLRSSAYKYFDDQPNTGYYGGFLVDERGLRHYMRHQKIENRFRLLRTGRQQESGLELNLSHVWHRIQQEPRDSSLQEVFVGGRWGISPFPALQVRAEGQLGVLGSAGDYQLKGEATLRMGEWGVLSGGLLSQLYQPTLLQQRLFVTQQLFWENDFRKTLETSVHAQLALPKWRLEIQGAYHLLDQAIYFDTARIARQANALQALGQLTLRKQVRVGKIYLDNQWTFQTVSGEVFRLPEWFGKHSLFFSGKMFKVLNVRFGADLRYTSAYRSDAYFPLTGQFHLQNEALLEWFPALDAFFNLQVTRFRAFVKVENIGGTLVGGRLFYLTPAYPRPPVSGFRLGISWRFSD